MATRDLFQTAPPIAEAIPDEEMRALVRGERGLAGRIRAARIGAGLTVDGMGVPHLKAYEQGQLRPGVDVLRTIAARTGADLSALLEQWDLEMPEGSRIRLAEARAMVDAAVRAEGGSCPCCGQAVRAREVALSAKLAVVVRAVVRGYRGGPVRVAAGAGLATDAALWDLTLPVTADAFLPTDTARAFLGGDLRLPRRLIVWQGRVIGQAGKPTAWGDLKVPAEGCPEALALL